MDRKWSTAANTKGSTDPRDRRPVGHGNGDAAVAAAQRDVNNGHTQVTVTAPDGSSYTRK